jgi:hypothetical protein
MSIHSKIQTEIENIEGDMPQDQEGLTDYLDSEVSFVIHLNTQHANHVHKFNVSSKHLMSQRSVSLGQLQMLPPRRVTSIMLHEH